MSYHYINNALLEILSNEYSQELRKFQKYLSKSREQTLFINLITSRRWNKIKLVVRYKLLNIFEYAISINFTNTAN